MYLFLLLLLSACASSSQKKQPLSPQAAPQSSQRAYTGIQLSGQISRFDPPLSHDTHEGIRVENVILASPAWEAGLRPGDIILNEKAPQDLLRRMYSEAPGTEFTLKVLSGVKLKTLKFKSVERNTAQGTKKYLEPAKLWSLSTQNSYLEGKIKTIRDPELEKKFKTLASRGDNHRPMPVRYMQENPLSIYESSQKLLELMRKCPPNAQCLNALDLFSKQKTPKIKVAGTGAQAHLKYMRSVLDQTAKLHARAFSKLTKAEKAYLEDNIDEISNRFMETPYLHDDVFMGRKIRYYEFSQILDKISISDLSLSLLFLTEHFSPNYFLQLTKDLKTARFPLKQKTPHGLIVITGRNDDDHTALSNTKTAMIVDLGGNDIYRDNSGIIVDLKGNDRYEASRSWLLGAARMNTSMFLDLEGNDNYECGVHCLGSSFLGASYFADLKGNDIYTSQVYSQGTSFAGISLFLDAEGNDKYRSFGMSQGVGIAGGYGILIDQAGNDIYQSLGIRPSSYGDAGQYESWSQGVGIGLRYFTSGGMGILYDKSGSDVFEAGTFSQGGGYSFGWGALLNDGMENDLYKGMRYTQGFAAHSAVGTFIDVGGNDQYHSLSVVGEGIAWDLSISLFEDKSGNDRYQTGSMCLGAASQSSYAFFLDHKGIDTYVGKELPSTQAIPNDYHGGKSIGYFLDGGGDEDIYEKFKNNSCQKRDGDHFMCDE